MRRNGPGQNGQQPRQKGGLVGFFKHSLIKLFITTTLDWAMLFDFMRVKKNAANKKLKCQSAVQNNVPVYCTVRSWLSDVRLYLFLQIIEWAVIDFSNSKYLFHSFIRQE